jgi:hypothetical protein
MLPALEEWYPCAPSAPGTRITQLGALGSFLMGSGTIANLVAPIAECLAQPGDVWAYATPILHASGRSRSTARRRVLQIDFCAAGLPAPLEWALQV